MSHGELIWEMSDEDVIRNLPQKSIRSHRRVSVMSLPDSVAGSYDLTRHADTYITTRLAHYLGFVPENSYLDLACGTGNYTLALCRPGLRFWGVDRSLWMLSTARQKSNSIPWCLGTAEALPFSDGSFSGAICVLAIHYFKGLEQAFAEVARVLGCGQFIIFTATPEQMRGYWLNEYFPKAMKKSIEQMPGETRVIDALEGAGFTSIRMEPYNVRDDLEDFFFYSGKHRPEIYLDPQVRAGISTFSIHAEAQEVEDGCQRLEADIRSGHINRLITSHEGSNKGDYLFIIGHKR